MAARTIKNPGTIKPKYGCRVANWAEYGRALVSRGDQTISSTTKRSSNTCETGSHVGLENTRSFNMNANFKSLLSKKVALALVMGVLAQPVLAQEMMAPRSLAEAAADAFNTSECDPKFMEKVAKAQYINYEGNHFVLVFTSSMMDNGVEADGAEPLMIGPLTKATTAAEAAAFKGRPICNEPF